MTDTTEAAFIASIREYIGLRAENESLREENQRLRQENARLRRELAALERNSTALTITGPEGAPIYLSGARTEFDWTRPMAWEDVEEHVDVRQVMPFSIIKVPSMELHIDSRTFRFADAQRIFCAHFQGGYIMFYYIFYPLPDVEIIVPFHFRVRPELVDGWTWDTIRDNPNIANPSHFADDQLEGPVTLSHVSFLIRFPDEEETEEEE